MGGNDDRDPPLCTTRAEIQTSSFVGGLITGVIQ